MVKVTLSKDVQVPLDQLKKVLLLMIWAEKYVETGIKGQAVNSPTAGTFMGNVLSTLPLTTNHMIMG